MKSYNYPEYKKNWYIQNKDKEREERWKNYPTITCACGCGGTIKMFDKRGRPVKYIWGHTRNGKKLSKEHIEKIKEANSKRIFRFEEIERLRQLAKDRIGKPLSEEQRRKIGEGCKGKAAWNKGKIGVYSEEFLQQKRISFSGPNNPKWSGGHYPIIYDQKFTQAFRNFIRRLDNHQCVLCYITQEELKRNLCVHHIDLDKKNSVVSNCISLCDKCHNKVHCSTKQDWKYILTKIVDSRQEVIIPLALM
jgi:hypothetical protein